MEREKADSFMQFDKGRGSLQKLLLQPFDPNASDGFKVASVDKSEASG